MKILFILFGLIVLLSACVTKYGSGRIITEERQLEGFSAIEVSGNIEVDVSTGSGYSVKVEADDNVMPYVSTNLSGDRLEISLAKNFEVNDGHLKITVTAPEIKAVEASASAEVHALSGLKSNAEVELTTSSAATIKASVDAPLITLRTSSGSKIETKGMCKTLKVTASSGSSIEAKDLLSETTNATSSSGASIAVYASVNLEARASSGASISYSGNPLTNIDESSGGSVRKK